MYRVCLSVPNANERTRAWHSVCREVQRNEWACEISREMAPPRECKQPDESEPLCVVEWCRERRNRVCALRCAARQEGV